MPTNEEVNKVFDKIIESQIIRWENIPPDAIKHNLVEEYFKDLVKELKGEENIHFERIVDENNYYWMSQTEVTDVLYRASVYSVETIQHITLFGLDIIKIVLF